MSVSPSPPRNRIRMRLGVRQGFPGGAVVKNPPGNAGDARGGRFNPCVRKIPWSKKWQPTPVFLPGKSCGQRNLVGYSPWVTKESDMT